MEERCPRTACCSQSISTRPCRYYVRFVASIISTWNIVVQAYFDAQATHIQRHFRGYHSRRHVHSMATRPRLHSNGAPEVARCAPAGRCACAGLRCLRQSQTITDHAAACADVHEIRVTLPAYDSQICESWQSKTPRRRLQRTMRSRATARRAAFSRQVGHLHHLLSTSAQPGILQPPVAVATGALAQRGGASLEDHIRARHRQQVRSDVPANCWCTLMQAFGSEAGDGVPITGACMQRRGPCCTTGCTTCCGHRIIYCYACIAVMTRLCTLHWYVSTLSQALS